MAPNQPPSNGPTEMPSPIAASYKTIACAAVLLENDTIAASEVATNNALPSPQPPRSPTSAQMPLENPPHVENNAMTTIPNSKVILIPSREETIPVMSIATAITAL